MGNKNATDHTDFYGISEDGSPEASVYAALRTDGSGEPSSLKRFIVPARPEAATKCPTLVVAARFQLSAFRVHRNCGIAS